MVDAAEAACSFVTGRQRDDLDHDQMLLFAVVRAIEIIGEAAARLSLEGRAAAPEVPWSPIIGMRNRMVHAYFSIDPDVVWQTVTVELPRLRQQLLTVLGRG